MPFETTRGRHCVLLRKQGTNPSQPPSRELQLEFRAREPQILGFLGGREQVKHAPRRGCLETVKPDVLLEGRNLSIVEILHDGGGLLMIVACNVRSLPGLLLREAHKFLFGRGIQEVSRQHLALYLSQPFALPLVQDPENPLIVADTPSLHIGLALVGYLGIGEARGGGNAHLGLILGP